MNYRVAGSELGNRNAMQEAGRYLLEVGEICRRRT
jgi:hypothetical protein